MARGVVHPHFGSKALKESLPLHRCTLKLKWNSHFLTFEGNYLFIYSRFEIVLLYWLISVDFIYLFLCTYTFNFFDSKTIITSTRLVFGKVIEIEYHKRDSPKLSSQKTWMFYGILRIFYVFTKFETIQVL